MTWEGAVWIIAFTGLFQLVWGLFRDSAFLKKNSESLVWDNERKVLLQNSEKAEQDAKTWMSRAEGLNDIAAKQGGIIRDLRARLQKAGIDDTQ